MKAKVPVPDGPKACRGGCQRPFETRGRHSSRCPDCGASWAVLARFRYKPLTPGAKLAP